MLVCYLGLKHAKSAYKALARIALATLTLLPGLWLATVNLSCPLKYRLRNSIGRYLINNISMWLYKCDLIAVGKILCFCNVPVQCLAMVSQYDCSRLLDMQSGCLWLFTMFAEALGVN